MKNVRFFFLLVLTITFPPASIQAQGLKLASRWALAPGDRTYITAGTNQRGLSYNPVTGHLILVNRSGGISVNILDSLTGDDLGSMDTSGLVNPGTFILSKVGVADDGVIYAANFGTIGSATPQFTVYRWSDEFSFASIAYAGDPGEGNIQQWGTTFDVRGQGTNSQILVTSSTGTIAALLTTEDGTSFTSRLLQTDALPGQMGIAVAFGASNTFWAKSVDGPLLQLSFDTNTGTATTLHNYSVTNFPGSVAPFMVNPLSNLLATINVTTPDTANLYDISNLSAAPVLLNSTNFPLDADNSLFMGAVDFAPGMVFALDSNNGLVAYDITSNSDPVPPSMVLHPRDTSVFVGATATLVSSAAGDLPLHYQWQFASANIPNATNAIFSIANAQATNEGDYNVVVTNTVGMATSLTAHLTVLPAGIMTPIWSLAPGSRAYLTSSGNNQRGMAFNPMTRHLILVNMAGGLTVNVLDGATGADLGTMATNGIAGGTFKLLMVGVADDGVIYGANFGSLPGTTPTVYRWANESAQPTIAFQGDPTGGLTNRQWGNTLDVRGAGTNTQILLPSGGQQYLAVLSTADGTNFGSLLFSGIPTGAVLEGAAFGAGNTFWGKSASGATLVHYSLNFTNGTVTAIDSFDSSLFDSTINPITLDVAHNLLAGVSIATPDTINLYDISNLGPGVGPMLLQAVNTPADNANSLFRGALDFGDEKLFALDTNNGLIAFALPYLQGTLSGTNVVISWQSTLAGFNLEGRTNLISGAWTPVSGATITSGRYTVTLSKSSAPQFFRLRK